MKILPSRTSPPASRIERCHNPKLAKGRYGYRTYRPCLRWEFGFTCAFCLLHEADLSEHGVEGTGLTAIEHFEAVSYGGAVNDYGNCFYVCRFCNQARSDAPVADARKGRLLDPCNDVWAEHFSLAAGDRLAPASRDAAYTHECYDLDDPRKVVRRRFRRERIAEWLTLLEEGPSCLEDLLALLDEQPGKNREALLRAADRLRRSINSALRDLERYAAVPPDANFTCRCGRQDHHALPTALDVQVMEIPLE